MKKVDQLRDRELLCISCCICTHCWFHGYFYCELFFFKSRYEFFNELYHRFLLTPKVNMKCLCLQALAIVYGRCHEEIGPFTDTRYIIGMLERVRISFKEITI